MTPRARSALARRWSSPRTLNYARPAVRKSQNLKHLVALSLRTRHGSRCGPMRSDEYWKDLIRRRRPQLQRWFRNRPVERISEWRFRHPCVSAASAHGDGLDPASDGVRITVPGSPDARVMLLRGRPGLQLPAHGHTGEEFTLILKGWLFDDRGAYGPGDFDEAGDEIDHQPVVGPDGECVCLAALDGDTRLHSRLGRWLRPLVGF